MTYIIILALYAAVLFLIALLSRRSLGVPTLTLAAGALMANLWTNSLTPLVAQAGVATSRAPLASIVAVALTLLPAVVIMFRSHKTTSKHHSLFGSLMFAVLGVMLTYGAFSDAVAVDAASKQYVTMIMQYQNIAITACICLAILSVLFYKKPVSHQEHHK